MRPTLLKNKNDKAYFWKMENAKRLLILSWSIGH